MQVNSFIECVDSSEKISFISETDIIPIIEEFPYCQTGQLMYAIQLNSTNSILFEEQLKKTASICPDRNKLFEYIHQEIEVATNQKTVTNKQVEEKSEVLVDNKFIPTEGKDELGLLEKEYLSQAISSSILLESESVVEEEAAPVKEINLFNEEAPHSFSSWLQHYNGDESQEVSSGVFKERNQDIINKFIQEDPRIEPKKTEFFSPTNMARLSVTDTGIVSETLALIHVDQGNYQEAINSYEKLMLKNPKKSSYFASQIKILKQKLK